MLWGASIPWPGKGVGCFDPAQVLHRLKEVFAEDLEFDETDLLSGHFERTLQAAVELGIKPTSPTVVSAAKLVREVSPRYGFRLRVGPKAFVSGEVDRYAIGIRCATEAEFPDPTRGKFMKFLKALKLGEIKVSV